MPKSTKRFILSNEKLNSRGFIVITAGIDYSDFLKNPVMYWMHQYPQGEKVQQNLPIGFWADLQVDGTNLTAVPVFNDNDDFAMKIYNMVEHGTIRAASVAIDPVKFDTDKANWVTGQKLPTVLKSILSEVSIVDRGANSDAVTFNGNSTAFIKLSKNADQFEDTPTPASKKALDGGDDSMQCGDGCLTPEMTAIVKNSIAAGKFTKPEMDKILSIATKAPEVISALKGIIRSTPIKPENIHGKYHHTLITMAANKSYDEINRTGTGMRGLGADAPELYKAKFFEKHGRMPGVLPHNNDSNN
jgi:hypothetical protein